jgi:broad specificity phosphatase PhoE
VTRLVLVRHGAVAAHGRCYGRRLDPELSEQGVAEVTALRGRLAARTDGRPRLVVRSPARRADATAALLGHDGTATVDPAWAERDLGAWEGRPWTELWDEVPPEVTTDPATFAAFTPPDGEPRSQLQARVAAALERLAADHLTDDPTAHPPVWVVTHAGPIVACLAHVLDLDEVVALRLRVATATATHLTRWPDGSWTVEAVAT